MLTFTTQKSITAITRQTYSGSPSKSVYTSVGTATCYLRPLTEEQASMNGFQFGQGYSAIFEIGVDIREADKLTISGTEYTVRGVVSHDRGLSTQYKRCLLTKQESN